MPSFYDSLCQIESASIVRENRTAEEFSRGHEVMLTRDEDGWAFAECPELPGCVSQGKDEAAAMANIREAIAGWFWAKRLKQSDSSIA